MKVVLGKKLFDYFETAQILGVSKPSVILYVKRKGITPVIISRKKYLSEDDIRKIVTPGQKATE